jgi:hypothetical protein
MQIRLSPTEPLALGRPFKAYCSPFKAERNGFNEKGGAERTR